MKHYDVAVIGGGLLGSAFAYGLSAQGVRVVLLDEGDNAIRTARGNFGLVWVQGKGQGMPQYALWSRRSAYAWTPFSEQLIEETGTDPGYHRPGGFCVALDEAEFSSNLKLMEQLQAYYQNHKMIEKNQLQFLQSHPQSKRRILLQKMGVPSSASLATSPLQRSPQVH